MRRIIRRAVLQARRIGLNDIHRLPAVVVGQMGDAYPELGERHAEIERVVRAEEERFGETLERGMRLFDELAGREAISGEEAFTLAATYGFPLELTVELAGERGQAVDVDGYATAMERHREISRAAGGAELQRAPDFARSAGFESEFVGDRKTDVLTQIGALEELEDGSLPRQAAGVAVLCRRAAARSPTRAGSSSTPTRRSAQSSSTRTASTPIRSCSCAARDSQPATGCARS